MHNVQVRGVCMCHKQGIVGASVQTIQKTYAYRGWRSQLMHTLVVQVKETHPYVVPAEIRLIGSGRVTHLGK